MDKMNAAEAIEFIKGMRDGIPIRTPEDLDTAKHNIDRLLKFVVQQQYMLQDACEILGATSRYCPIPNSKRHKKCVHCSDKKSAKCWKIWFEEKGK